MDRPPSDFGHPKPHTPPDFAYSKPQPPRPATPINPSASNLNINFLAKPKPVDLLAEARILRLSKRQAVCEVQLYSLGEEDELVAHVTGTYALPV